MAGSKNGAAGAAKKKQPKGRGKATINGNKEMMDRIKDIETPGQKRKKKKPVKKKK